MSVNADQIAYWNALAGATWAQLQDRLDRQLAPLGDAALVALAAAPGESIIDVGCGCGASTLDLAQAVSPGGHVLGIDVSAPMLAVARARLEGLATATILQADAQSHDFTPAAADGVYSRFGVMFFDDPQAAFANLRRALKPGGRLAFVCWRPLSQNAWMAAPLAAACAALGETPPAGDPDAPGPFAFADPQRVRTILAGAGFVDVAVDAHDTPINGGDLDDAVAMAFRVGPLGALVREQPHKAEPARAAVRAALAAFETPAGVLTPAAVWIVSARG